LNWYEPAPAHNGLTSGLLSIAVMFWVVWEFWHEWRIRKEGTYRGLEGQVRLWASQWETILPGATVFSWLAYSSSLSFLHGLLFYPEDEGSSLLQNTGTLLPNYMV